MKKMLYSITAMAITYGVLVEVATTYTTEIQPLMWCWAFLTC